MNISTHIKAYSEIGLDTWVNDPNVKLISGGTGPIPGLLITSPMRKPIGTTARTGEKCPESGIWEVMGSPSTTAPIAQHNTMPPYNGGAVTWKLIRYA